MRSPVRLFAEAWSWLVDGATEAVARGLDRLRPRPLLRVDLANTGGTVRAAGGATVARLVEAGAVWRLEPPGAASRLAGARVELECPPAWLFRRTLEPVAAQGAPFLDAFVRHQVDRLTPWRAEDVDLCVRHAPLPGDPDRLSVEFAVVPRSLTGKAAAALAACDPARLDLVAAAPAGGARYVMPVGAGAAVRHGRLRSRVALGLAAYLLAWPLLLGWLWWSTAATMAEVAEADTVIEQRRSVLAAASRQGGASDELGATLAALQQKQPRVVDVIEALSAALPDSAYVTSMSIAGVTVRVSGVSTDPATLVPALEASGRFAGAAFFDTTTRLEGPAPGDRFHLEATARVRPADR